MQQLPPKGAVERKKRSDGTDNWRTQRGQGRERKEVTGQTTGIYYAINS